MKVDRLVGIILLLLEKKRIGAQELADMYEVSPRTIYRDIDAINLAGIPVLATSGVGGGFEIMQNYKIDKTVFSTADLSTILMGLSSLSGMMRGNELVNALAKVKSFIPADRAKDIEVKASHIHIDLSPWMGNRNIRPNLEIVKTALEESRLLSFDYADRHGNKTARTAEPYQLVLKGSHWYWHGYCRARRDFRLFKVARTSNLRMSDERFEPRERKQPRLDVTDIVSPMQTNITVRFHKSVLDRVLDYCPIDRCAPDGDDHYLVAFPFIENDYYYAILFGFGDKCECIEPPRICGEMKRRLRGIAGLYER